MSRLEEWIALQQRLIDLEKGEEIVQLQDKMNSLSGKQCQSSGLSLLHLEVEASRSALFGRCCLTLRKMDKGIMQQSFKVGDEVSLYNPKFTSSSSTTGNGDLYMLFGLVSKASNNAIEIIVDDFENDHYFDPPLRMDLRSSQKTHSTMKTALSALLHEGRDHLLVRLLFFPEEVQHLDLLRPPRAIAPIVTADSGLSSNTDGGLDNTRANMSATPQVWNNDLNSSQQAAITCALASPSVSIIHGPPGTGKTSTITELIMQAVHRGMKLLVCAPSNIAVDTVLARLAHCHHSCSTQDNRRRRKQSPGGGVDQRAKLHLHMVRLGHPARISSDILKYSLDALIASDEGTEIVADVRKDIDALRSSMSRGRDYKRHQKRGDEDEDGMSRQQQRTELKALTKEARRREREVVRRIIDRSNVVLCTCITAGSRLLEDVSFDLVVIDEAAQGLEAACWIPILKGKRCVLAGDHCQLPPTIKSQEAEKGGLGVTLFERIIGDSRFRQVVSLLDTQYRMNSLISDWASRHMYHNAIQSHSSVEGHTLSDFSIVDRSRVASDSVHAVANSDDQSNRDGLSSFPVLLLVDTSECGMLEDSVSADEGGSHRNYHEADLVHKHVVALVEAGMRPNQIGVITPYNAQLDVLRNLLLSTGLSNAITESDRSTSGMQPASANNSGEGRKQKGIKPPLTVDAISSRVDKLHKPSSSSSLSLEGLEIKTIDGFQGGEKECILLSLVRSNATHSVGFLGEKRRINVAVTRAKRHLAVFCDVATCAVNPFMKGLLNHMAEHGDHISADEYVDYIASGADASQGSSASITRSKAMIHEESHRSERCRLERQDFMTLLQRFQQGDLLASTLPASSSSSNKQQSMDIEVVAAGGNLCTNTSSDKDGIDSSNSKLNREAILVKYLPKDSILRFPSALTSYQRMLIHECAEELHLHHRSENRLCANKAIVAAYERFIEVSTTEFQTAAISDATDNRGSGGVVPVGAVTKAHKSGNKTAVSMNAATMGDASSNKDSIINDIMTKDDLSDPPQAAPSISASDHSAVHIHTKTTDQSSTGTVKDMTCDPATTTADEDKRSIVVEHQNNSSDDSTTATITVNKASSNNINKKNKKSSTTNSSTSSTMGKVYVGSERMHHRAMMEQRLQVTLEDTSKAEDDLIEAAIQHNQHMARYNQYRVPSTALPNPEKMQNKQLLKAKILQVAHPTTSTSSRSTAGHSEGSNIHGLSTSSSSQSNSTHNSSRKKVVKKPPPNFGGGKLGSS